MLDLSVILAQPESPYSPLLVLRRCSFFAVRPHPFRALESNQRQRRTLYQPGPQAQVQSPINPQRAESSLYIHLFLSPTEPPRWTPALTHCTGSSLAGRIRDVTSSLWKLR